MYRRRRTDESARICWGICMGMADYKMGWYYTMEEIKEKMKVWGK